MFQLILVSIKNLRSEVAVFLKNLFMWMMILAHLFVCNYRGKLLRLINELPTIRDVVEGGAPEPTKLVQFYETIKFKCINNLLLFQLRIFRIILCLCFLVTAISRTRVFCF